MLCNDPKPALRSDNVLSLAVISGVRDPSACTAISPNQRTVPLGLDTIP